MKKILILNGGPRMHNNTAKLLAAVGEGLFLPEPAPRPLIYIS